MEHITLKDIEDAEKYLKEFEISGNDSPAPLYHEQEYPLNLVNEFGHRIDFWEDQTLLIAITNQESG